MSESNIIEANFRKEGESFQVKFGMLEMTTTEKTVMWVPCIIVKDGEFQMQMSSENQYFSNKESCQAFLENLAETIKHGHPSGLIG